MLERALEFLGLNPDFSEEDLKNRFYFLSKKYHPDTGEFSSDSLFKELIEYRDVLSAYLEQKIFKKTNVSSAATSSQSKTSKDAEYSLYKQAREIYDSAIHEYYKLTDGNPIFLKGEENPALRKLRHSLEISKSGFETLIASYPQSIWVADAKDTLHKIDVWFKAP
ncbi:DnaJ domain-containing protein [Leptospira yasudae]|uniref:Molecular chaperone DnaJ n=1 Tax=Leptospira yasudae TaxID=2202201 RepID=A0A6N4QX34_9LEPT|nr:DnaJ domain-containing protein [Leptospira yasudae]TGL76330.1 molecular chaperone DnaJ [Leptospira yasudae]TGL76671.1 molecular chaperone DnaJ [Leptospira yasudae]TGL90105.1 molecular chaperone DnaJ [Leptospira yasudae]